jgi:hypothetical protein
MPWISINARRSAVARSSPRGERSLPVNPFENDPVVGENAARHLTIVVNRLPVALRPSREHARFDGLMALIRLLESIELPRPNYTEDVLATISGYQRGHDRPLDDRTANERR